MDCVFDDISVDGGRVMALISYAIFAILSVVSLLHFGWAFGMAWPAKTRAELPAWVAGAPIGSPMPPAALTFGVAIAIFGLGVAALWGAAVFSLSGLDVYRAGVLLAITAVFALRGIATYLPFGPLHAAVEPFRRLDLRYFAPLCLWLAAGYFTLYMGL